MAFRSLAVAPWLLACVVEPSLPPPGKNMTGPVTGPMTGADESDDTAETGTPGDIPGCDPLADPESECGPGMTCDLTSRACVPALGDGLGDDPCADTDECSPGLVCVSGRCRVLCDAQLGDPDAACDEAQICSVAADPIPGLCLASCDLVFDACSFPDDACKRVIGPGGQVFAACIANPGEGLTGDACVADPECAPGYLCTAGNLHTLPCANEAASCCAPICDTLALPCVGLEPSCYVLGIPGQESAGFCGA